MGFLLDAIIEGMKMVFVVGFVYAILNQTMVTEIFPLLDEVTSPEIATFKTLVMYVWFNWGTLTILGAVIYGIVAALRKTDTYGTY